jgi:hypothetical protein
MPKQTIDSDLAESFQARLVRQGLSHLRVTRRADLLTLHSGTPGDLVAHARFRRETVHLWRLEIADGKGRWQVTELRDLLNTLLQELLTSFPWVVAPRD